MKVDMSPEAVTIRLKRVSQLRRLCLELGKMKPVISTKTTDSNGKATDPKTTLASRKRSDGANARRRS
jgi:hypothetical protein